MSTSTSPHGQLSDVTTIGICERPPMVREIARNGLGGTMNRRTPSRREEFALLNSWPARTPNSHSSLVARFRPSAIGDGDAPIRTPRSSSALTLQGRVHDWRTSAGAPKPKGAAQCLRPGHGNGRASGRHEFWSVWARRGRGRPASRPLDRNRRDQDRPDAGLGPQSASIARSRLDPSGE